jgi:hypothetical protein
MRKTIKKILMEDELDWIRDIDPVNFYDENNIPNNRERIYYDDIMMNGLGEDWETVLEDEFGLYSATAADFLLYETDLESFDDRFEFLYEEISFVDNDRGYSVLKKFYKRFDNKYFVMDILHNADGQEFDEEFMYEVFPILRVKFL